MLSVHITLASIIRKLRVSTPCGDQRRKGSWKYGTRVLEGKRHRRQGGVVPVVSAAERSVTERIAYGVSTVGVSLTAAPAGTQPTTNLVSILFPQIQIRDLNGWTTSSGCNSYTTR